MTEWPKVRDEFQTLDAVLAGKSIGRLGDGEFPWALGSKNGGGRQDVYAAGLVNEMRAVVTEPHPSFICAIPTMVDRGPNGMKAPKFRVPNPTGPNGGWYRHIDRYLKALSPDMTYYSAFITRPDSAPWISNKEFCLRFQEVWAGKSVVVIAPKENKLVNVVKVAARSLVWHSCPRRNAYESIDKAEKQVLDVKPDVALLSCGPTATVLARRLASQGVHAVDIGSAGGFLMRYLLGKGDGSRDAPVKVRK